MHPKRSLVRCAVYTRKSSDEGLEQSFNSLDAQREACVAYIQSQKHEGWKVIDAPYDDGGYSGGSMDRPALKRLLYDIDAGLVDTVVVYKVDRLTRSLTDFAKIVEAFDGRGVTFVSVTQHFNTTTSMGRLTLNVLLSFAQFEREVTGERIRDKVAASKKKGMWMGGPVPIGYDVKDRKLLINEREADVVRLIYNRYLELGSVKKLKDYLDATGIQSKQRVSKSGVHSGGISFFRGALYAILGNRLYIGEIEHYGNFYHGQHEAIVAFDVWEKVQQMLRANLQADRVGLRAMEPSLLSGILFDGQGNRLTSSHSTKHGKRYRYYVSQAIIQHRPIGAGLAQRIPAFDVEAIVMQKLGTLLGSATEVSDTLGLPDDDMQAQQNLATAAKQLARRFNGLPIPEARSILLAARASVIIRDECVEIRLGKVALRAAILGERPAESVAIKGKRNNAHSEELLLTIEVRLKRFGRAMRLILPGISSADTPHHNSALIKAVARGYSWYEKIISGEATTVKAIAAKAGYSESHANRIIRCALLAPDIVEQILAGKQPPGFNLKTLRSDIPIDWTEQRHLFGFSKS